ncbi:MAG: M81 family metallopeptidase [Verrucomicrobiaceae bacterium]|nr:M81 family metallopeptidase [Verrucomicrobiaceae bacterium]
MKKLRVGIVGLLQESNTFIDGTTTLAHFEADLLLRGEAIREAMAGAPHEVGGFFAGLDEAGIAAVPLFLARALPYGVIDQGAFETLMAEMLDTVAEAGPLDGYLAAPHGATVAAGYPDADGEWLGRLRQQIGEGTPLIASLDPHANLTPAMVGATDAIIAYATNPHLDQRETGKKAAWLMARTLSGEVSPVQAAAYPPLAINIQSQNTSVEPLRSLYAEAETLFSAPGLLGGSVILGFPYADVDLMGSSVLVLGDGSDSLPKAQETADELASVMWKRRHDFDPVFLGIDEALSRVAASEKRPVVLLDMGDNVGGGSPADSTAILQTWRRRGEGTRLFAVLHDAAAARLAHESGVETVIEADVGDPADPVRGRFRVVSLHEGRFHESQARHGGFSIFDQGPTAVLAEEGGGLVLMVTTRRMAPFSLAQLTSCGVDPEDFDGLVAKGVIAPMAAYAPVARGGFLHVDSPGVTRADMTKLSYRHRRVPLFPFEQ